MAEKLYLRLCRREDRRPKTLAALSPILLVQQGEGDDESPQILPTDRARAWEELTRWVEYLIIFPDPAVQAGQYQNRLKGEAWEHVHAERPGKEDLYDWRLDEPTLQRLRPIYRPACDKLIGAIGRPNRDDFGQRYPNEYDDIGLSDAARKVIRELKAIFGPEIFNS